MDKFDKLILIAILILVIFYFILLTVDNMEPAKYEPKPITGDILATATIETSSPTIPEVTTEPTVITEPVIETVITEPTETTIIVTEPPTEPEEWVYLGTFKCTAYCSCQKCCGKWALNRPKDENGNEIVYTASGARAVAGVTIATDKSVLPFGTVVKVNGNTYIAQDTGSGVVGNHIDIYFDSHEEARKWGMQYHDLWVKKG